MIKRKWWLKPIFKRRRRIFFSRMRFNKRLGYLLTLPPPPLFNKIISNPQMPKASGKTITMRINNG